MGIFKEWRDHRHAIRFASLRTDITSGDVEKMRKALDGFKKMLEHGRDISSAVPDIQKSLIMTRVGGIREPRPKRYEFFLLLEQIPQHDIRDSFLFLVNNLHNMPTGLLVLADAAREERFRKYILASHAIDATLELFQTRSDEANVLVRAIRFLDAFYPISGGEKWQETMATLVMFLGSREFMRDVECNTPYFEKLITCIATMLDRIAYEERRFTIGDSAFEREW